MLAGALVTLLGICAVALTWSLHQHDAHLRARFIPATATRFDVNGTSIVSFKTRTGRRIRTEEPQQHGDPAALGPPAGIPYDPPNPRPVITGAKRPGRDTPFSIS